MGYAALVDIPGDYIMGPAPGIARNKASQIQQCKHRNFSKRQRTRMSTTEKKKKKKLVEEPQPWWLPGHLLTYRLVLCFPR